MAVSNDTIPDKVVSSINHLIDWLETNQKHSDMVINLKDILNTHKKYEITNIPNVYSIYERDYKYFGMVKIFIQGTLVEYIVANIYEMDYYVHFGYTDLEIGSKELIDEVKVLKIEHEISDKYYQLDFHDSYDGHELAHELENTLYEYCKSLPELSADEFYNQYKDLLIAKAQEILASWQQ